MAAPLVLFVPALVAEIAGAIAAATAIIGLAVELRDQLREQISGLLGDLLVEGVEAVIVQYAQSELGLSLDSDNPLSPESLTRAISEKTGIEFTDITDPEATKEDAIKYGLDKVAEQTGIEFIDIADPEQIKADLIKYGLGQVASELGLDPGDGTIEGLVQSLRDLVKREILEAIELEGEGLEDIRDAVLGRYCDKKKDADPERQRKLEDQRARARRYRENNPLHCDC
jgi:hypothetical protein